MDLTIKKKKPFLLILFTLVLLYMKGTKRPTEKETF